MASLHSCLRTPFELIAYSQGYSYLRSDGLDLSILSRWIEICWDWLENQVKIKSLLDQEDVKPNWEKLRQIQTHPDKWRLIETHRDKSRHIKTHRDKLRTPVLLKNTLKFHLIGKHNLKPQWKKGCIRIWNHNKFRQS